MTGSSTVDVCSWSLPSRGGEVTWKRTTPLALPVKAAPLQKQAGEGGGASASTGV
jgi:hypothetical protein